MKSVTHLFILCISPIFCANAQQELELNRLSSFALKFASPQINADPYSMMPSVAMAYGFGSYMDNPASMALIEDSEFMFSFYRQDNNASNFYLENKDQSGELSHKLGSIGIAYSIPTIRGNLVIGGGYNQRISDTNEFRISGRNNTSTITDSFLEANNKFFDLAFATYATDWGDVEQTYLESIFRIGFEPGVFPGINQEAAIRSETYAGEYTAFLATEFKKNLFVGLSASYLYGDSRYREHFLELDVPNDYDGDFIEGSDIADILVSDSFDTEIRAYKFRTGLVYKVGRGISVGASYQLPSTYRISERNNYSIRTTLDDNSQPFFSEIESNGAFRYRIRKPGIFKAGITYDKNRFSVSTSAEYAKYKNFKYDLVSDREARTSNLEVWKEKEKEVNSFLKQSYRSVLNLLIGAEFNFSEELGIRAGYAFLPERYEFEPGALHRLAAGVSYTFWKNLRVDITGQYLKSKKQTILYEYVDFDNETQSSNFVSEVRNVRVLAAVKILF